MRDYSKAGSGAAFSLALLFAINAVNFYDRQVASSMAEPIRKEWSLGDAALGALGTAFVLLYAAAGLPLGRLADRLPRKRILAAGVFIWSLLTAASGLARSYWQLFALRLGVGVGEAACAPASASLIGDLFPARLRGRAMSIFMLGLPAGIALSYFASGRIAEHHGWRAAFLVAGVPGLACAALALLLREPQRGAAERGGVPGEGGGAGQGGGASAEQASWGQAPAAQVPEDRVPGARALGGQMPVGQTSGGRAHSCRAGRSPFISILSIPTMRWVVLSGVFHNFNAYALGLFLVAYLQRHHQLTLREAGDVSMVVQGLSGLPGLVLGGLAADAAARRGSRGRLLLGAASALASAPLVLLALGRPAGATGSFTLLMGSAYALIYVYYSTVYSSIQDVVEPPLRGTAMAVYFCAMYLLGGALGPYATGALSEHFTRQAAAAAATRATEAAADPSIAALEPFRAEGLRSAMHVIPILCVLLAAVLLAASRTVSRDAEDLRRELLEQRAPERRAPGGAAREELS